jgi:hypothetical protein
MMLALERRWSSAALSNISLVLGFSRTMNGL